jgi:1-acyl-sn-glycerol-3-phosphate acyltransferase
VLHPNGGDCTGFAGEIRKALVNPAGACLVTAVKALVGAYPRWHNHEASGQCIYFANHTSHIDTLAIWSALRPGVRARSRPVAASDYWGQRRLRRYVAVKVLNAVLIERQQEGRRADPLQPLVEALDQGDSLIMFPEGTRGCDRLPGLFKSGIFHLARQFPAVHLIPVYLENLNRVMPKGTRLPIPLMCTVHFGATLSRIADESKDAFLQRARAAVVELA